MNVTVVDKAWREQRGTDAGSQLLKGSRPAGVNPWSLRIGAPGEGDEYVGHLVAITREKIIDLSLDQGSRPHKGMHLDPVVLPLVKGPNPQVVAHYRTVDGCDVLWTRDEKNPGDWKFSKNWNSSEPTISDLITRTVDYIRASSAE